MADRIELGGGGAVAVGSEVVADPFDAVEEEFAFLWVERETPFGEDVADAFEIEEEDVWGVAEKENIVDDLAVAGVDEFDSDEGHVDFGVFFAEEGLPFLPHEEHEDCVTCWCVDGAKRHDVEGVE